MSQCVSNLTFSTFSYGHYVSSTITALPFWIHFYNSLSERRCNKEDQEVIVAAQLAIIYAMCMLQIG
jgi:hypothetical protein